MGRKEGRGGMRRGELNWVAVVIEGRWLWGGEASDGEAVGEEGR